MALHFFYSFFSLSFIIIHPASPFTSYCKSSPQRNAFTIPAPILIPKEMLSCLSKTVYTFMLMLSFFVTYPFILHSFNLLSYFIYLYIFLNEIKIYIILIQTGRGLKTHVYIKSLKKTHSSLNIQILLSQPSKCLILLSFFLNFI